MGASPGTPLDLRDARMLDRAMAVVDALGFRRWRRRIVAPAAGRVLELGSGTGRNARYYPAGKRYVAVEPDPAALTYARSRGRAQQAALVCARAEALPFRDQTFDTAVVTLVFCSVGDPGRGAQELARTLRPEGEVRGAEHVLVRGLVGRLQRRVAPAWARLSGGCNLDRETMTTFRQAGLEPTERARSLRGVFRAYTARPVREVS
jgi:SAM-dependent methyltransferase